MTVTEHMSMKLTLARQLLVKDSYTEFHENPTNGFSVSQPMCRDPNLGNEAILSGSRNSDLLADFTTYMYIFI